MITFFRRMRLSHAMKVALAISTLTLLIICGVAVEYALTLQVISRSQSQWCSTLDLLTKDKVPYPADPKANPSRVEAYVLYEDFIHIKDQFGCR